MTKTYSCIDLFCGAGGMAEGFKSAGFRTLFANDIEEPALTTFARNHPDARTQLGPVEDVDPARLRAELGLEPGDLDVLLGGPPCQGFSTYGQRDPDDHRNGLFQYMLAFLDEFRPKAFLMENVVGILSMEGGRIVEDLRNGAADLGYAVNVVTLDAAHFGVPQSRKRVFFIGGAGNSVVEGPQPTHGTEVPPSATSQTALFSVRSLQAPLTVRDAISDLPEDAVIPKMTHEIQPYPTPSRPLTDYQTAMRQGSDALASHSAKQMLGIRRLRLALMRPGDYGRAIADRIADGGLPKEAIDELLYGRAPLRELDQCRKVDREKELALREMLSKGHTTMKQILKFLDSGGFANKYRRLHWDEPSHTLVAHMARDCSDFVHPDIDRFISVREAARLQSFPDRYYFCGSQFHQFRQIGNAVPPLLAAALGRCIVAFLGNVQGKRVTRNPVKASALPSRVAT